MEIGDSRPYAPTNVYEIPFSVVAFPSGGLRSDYRRGNGITDMKCDLLIKNGTLLDPGTGMNQKADIAAKRCEIAFIGKSGDNVRAKQIGNSYIELTQNYG